MPICVHTYIHKHVHRIIIVMLSQVYKCTSYFFAAYVNVKLHDFGKEKVTLEIGPCLA